MSLVKPGQFPISNSIQINLTCHQFFLSINKISIVFYIFRWILLEHPFIFEFDLVAHIPCQQVILKLDQSCLNEICNHSQMMIYHAPSF